MKRDTWISSSLLHSITRNTPNHLILPKMDSKNNEKVDIMNGTIEHKKTIFCSHCREMDIKKLDEGRRICRLCGGPIYYKCTCGMEKHRSAWGKHVKQPTPLEKVKKVEKRVIRNIKKIDHKSALKITELLNKD